MIKRLAPSGVPSPNKPIRGGARDHQRLMEAIALDPARSWSAALAHAIASEFDHLAPVWDNERGYYRSMPLEDALRRGGPFP